MEESKILLVAQTVTSVVGFSFFAPNLTRNGTLSFYESINAG